MKIALFDTHHFERRYFDEANQAFNYTLNYFESRLSEETATLVFGHDVVCPFINDRLDENTLRVVKVAGVKLIALRSAGFNVIDLDVAARLELPVVRVPEYSPYAVAEYAVALIQALNRKIYKSYSRVREGNFSLEGLVGFELHGKTIGIVGTGKIGSVMVRIMAGFGCRVLANDLRADPQLSALPGVSYVGLDQLYGEADIISLHVPLTPETHHLIDERALSLTKPGVMLINTGRGALIDSRALIAALKSCHIGYAGLDVYEEEESFFFRDLSEQVIQDDILARLLTFPNVLISSHQGFLTQEALVNVAQITLRNVADFQAGKPLLNQVLPEKVCQKAA